MFPPRRKFFGTLKKYFTINDADPAPALSRDMLSLKPLESEKKVLGTRHGKFTVSVTFGNFARELSKTTPHRSQPGFGTALSLKHFPLSDRAEIFSIVFLVVDNPRTVII